MAALMYVDVPGYSAIILRKDTQRLRLSGGLIPRSQQWLAGKGATWSESDRRWTFPTGGAGGTAFLTEILGGMSDHQHMRSISAETN